MSAAIAKRRVPSWVAGLLIVACGLITAADFRLRRFSADLARITDAQAQAEAEGAELLESAVSAGLSRDAMTALLVDGTRSSLEPGALTDEALDAYTDLEVQRALLEDWQDACDYQSRQCEAWGGILVNPLRRFRAACDSPCKAR